MALSERSATDAAGNRTPIGIIPCLLNFTSPVEGLDPAEEFLVVPAVDENLRVVLHTVRQHPEHRSGI